MSDPIDVFVQIAGLDVLAGRMWSHGSGKQESVTFAYADGYLSSSSAYELDPLLPLIAGQQQTPLGRAIFGAFSDCAPDGWGRRLILLEHRRETGREPTGYPEVSFLMGTRDDMRQGALRFRYAGQEEFQATPSSAIPPLVRLAQLVNASASLERDEASDEQLRLLLRAGSSLGGARPKAQVVDNNGRLSIAKFPRVQGDDWDVIRWEAVAHELAGEAGMTVSPARLELIENNPVLILERFDRTDRAAQDGGPERIGYVSAMTRLETTDGMPGDYLEIAAVTERQRDRQQLWRRIAFTMLISNTDDHLRNHGYLRLSTSGWDLSPAFDINPNPEGGPFATQLNGDDGGDINNLLDLANHFDLTAEQANTALREVVEATSGWAEVASRVGISKSEIGFMAAAFERQAAVQAKEVIDSR
ncbi:MAG: type II toxin-antitoxin system HipA family toxin [Solirubrobacteraceae bacterium]